MSNRNAATLAPGDLRDADRDSLHILPLSIIPLQSRGIQRARLIKNARLEGVIEMYSDLATGSGQISIEDLPGELGWPGHPPHPDLVLLRRLGELPSYDVYSLRIALREMGVSVNDAKGLQLSPRKVAALTEYMSEFTVPLIRQIYGSDDQSIESIEDIIGLFKSPNVAHARERLQTMAERLNIRIHEIPLFLENYGDIFLAVSYYRCCLDEIMPSVELFMHSVESLQDSQRHRADAMLNETSKEMVERVTNLATSVGGCLESFERSTRDLWDNLSAERFRAVQKMIQDYYTAIGGTLCCLSVKVDAWANRFPRPEAASKDRQAQFLMSEMRQGFETIKQFNLTPMLTALAS